MYTTPLDNLDRKVTRRRSRPIPQLTLAVVIIFSLLAATAAHSQAASTVEEGSLAPEFALKTLDGKPVRLSDYRGKLVLVNFWATWCAPCERETPILVHLSNTYRDQGLVVLGIDQDDDTDAARKFAAGQAIPYPILVGDDETAHAYIGLQGLPVTVLVDRDGKVLKKMSGAITSASELESVLRPLMSTPH
jgi:cytochrome c biogenesis protein CcmG, thiol:disulfide interchange protein DsbE